MPKSNRNCCVINCQNTESSCQDRNIRFYSFPGKSYEAERRLRWIRAVNRKNKDGSPWVPTKYSRICSLHFVGGQRSTIQSHPAYVPTIFSDRYLVKMKKCFLCGGRDKLLSFNEHTFTKCSRMSIVRKRKNFRYSDIVLPDEMTSAAYHVRCYKQFTVLSQKYAKEAQSILENEDIQASQGQSRETSRGMKGTMSEDSVEIPVLDEITAREILPEKIDIKCEELEEGSHSALQEERRRSAEEVAYPHSSLPQHPRRPCIFCGRMRKQCGKSKRLISICSSRSKIEKFIEWAETIGDLKVLNKLRDCDSFPQHRVCSASFRNKYNAFVRAKLPKSKGQWHELRKLHEKAFSCLSAFIDQEIIKNEKVVFLQDLCTRYKCFLIELSSFAMEDFKSYRTSDFKTKIQNAYGSRLIICASRTIGHKSIVYKRDIDVNKPTNKDRILQLSEQNKLVEVACSIRRAIKSVTQKTLPQQLKVAGECNIPDVLVEFIKVLIQGGDLVRRPISDDDFVKINSLSWDITCAINNGEEADFK